MRFVYLDSRFTLHASFPRSVALTQLRFACLAVASLAGDFHPEECAHAGRTKKATRNRVAGMGWDGKGGTGTRLGGSECSRFGVGHGRVLAESLVHLGAVTHAGVDDVALDGGDHLGWQLDAELF